MNATNVGSTLAEACVVAGMAIFGLASIIIPFPHGMLGFPQ